MYYRTTHPVGTLIVSRTQRFLYWIRPNVVAIRYGVGVGPECVDTIGMFHILRKEEQPAAGSASVSRQGTSSATVLRALYFGEGMSLSGTDAVASIGSDTASIGCILLTNPDSVELYDRVALQEAVVISE